MANIAISALPVATSQAGADVLPIVQATTSTTKQLSVTTLFTNPTFVAPALGTVASGNISACTSTGQVLTTPTLNTPTLNSPTMTTPVLGTPASGTVTNLTGTASININGTVGATTPAAGAFTTVSATGTSTVAAVNASASCSIVNGGGNESKLRIGNAAPVTLDIGVYNPYFTLAAGVVTTVTNHPLQFGVNNTLVGQFTSTGLAVTGTLTSVGKLGYATGAGGTVTQATSKATGVTLSKSTGQITLNAAALASDTTVSFTLTNTVIEAGDILVMNHISAGTAGSYLLNAQSAAGSASINVRNITAGSLSEAIVIAFAVIKAVTA